MLTELTDWIAEGNINLSFLLISLYLLTVQTSLSFKYDEWVLFFHMG